MDTGPFKSLSGITLIGRPLALTAVVGLLLLEMLGMGGTVAITAGLFLPAGFHAGIRCFRLHIKPPKLLY